MRRSIASEKLLRQPKLADAWVQRMVEECEEVGADGVDIDFEHWPAQGRYAFTEFFRRIPAFSLRPDARCEATPGLKGAPHVPIVWVPTEERR